MRKTKGLALAAILVLALAAILVLAMLLLVSCSNKTLFDTTLHFDFAMVLLPDGSYIEGKLQSWTDYADGDQLQVKIDGVTYLTHATNVVLMSGSE